MNLGNIKKIILFLIIFLAVFLRIYELGSIPVSVDWDEAALGYNAYSILKTGRDEYGEFLPIVLRSFNDYKPALYSYLAIPSIGIFGLNNFAVRLPSAVFGVLSVLATYFLVIEIFMKRQDSGEKSYIEEKDEKKNQISYSKNLTTSIALLTSALLAVSPWHIQFSRVAFEANIGLSLNIFSALFFLKSFKKPYLLSFSAVFSALSIYSYQSEKVFVPLFILSMVLIYRKEVLALPKKYIANAIFFGLCVVFPMIFYLSTNPEALSRARGSIITSTQTTFLEKNVERVRIDREVGDIAGLVFDNRRVEYFKSAIGGYLSHFDINWLFITGDSARHRAPGMGLLYHWELPFLLIGIYGLIFSNYFPIKDKRSRIFIFAWFLLAPVPAAFTTDIPHAVRTLNFLPTFQMFTAAGILLTVHHVFNIKLKVLTVKLAHILILGYSLFVVFNFVYYLNQYFVQINHFYSKYWQYGRQEEVDFVKSVESEYDKIIVSNKDFLDQSYIFYLYYLSYSPDHYQKNFRTFSQDGKYVKSFGKYEFRELNWDKEKIGKNTLFIGGPKEFTESTNTLKTINYLNGEEAVKIVGGKHE